MSDDKYRIWISVDSGPAMPAAEVVTSDSPSLIFNKETEHAVEILPRHGGDE